MDQQEAKSHQQAIRAGDRSRLPGLVRISFGCYNNQAEVDHLIEMLEKIVRRDFQGRYVQDPASGEFWCEGYRPRTTDYFTL